MGKSSADDGVLRQLPRVTNGGGTGSPMTQKDRPNGEKGLDTADLLGAQQIPMGQLATAVTEAQVRLPLFCRSFLSGGSGEGGQRESVGEGRRRRRGRFGGV